jgi:cAMP-specific phosphodiesterase 4/calcium/calmodulin-dependent 3',5'-cyclic nucleotide phosphodiesterase
MNKFKGKLSSNALSFEEKSDRQLIMEMIVKMGDLNNPSKNFNQSQKWSYRVMEEFFMQGDLERKANLPITKFMDRHDTNIPKWY